jgi:hypothetical protein
VASETWQDLGDVDGLCTVCAADGLLRLGETRTRLSLAERLRRTHAAPPSRQVTCHGCGWRWSVRVTDTPPVAATVVAGRRVPEPPGPAEPRPACADERSAVGATRDVLPAPGGRRRRTARLH